MDEVKKFSIGQWFSSLSVRAKLVLGFTVLSAMVAGLTASGIYNNTKTQLTPELRGLILDQFVLVVFVAIGLGAFFGAVAGNALTEPIISLKQKALLRSSPVNWNRRLRFTSRDEIGKLTETFNNMAGEIRGLISGLEQRVADRTKDLEARTLELEFANKRNQTRATQFEALTQVTQTITSVRDLQALLPIVTRVISEKFRFYHVGVFLLDEVGQYAILSAAKEREIHSRAAGLKRLEVVAEVEADGVNDAAALSNLEAQVVVADDSRRSVELNPAQGEHRTRVAGTKGTDLVQDTGEFRRQFREVKVVVNVDLGYEHVVGDLLLREGRERLTKLRELVERDGQSGSILVSTELKDVLAALDEGPIDVEARDASG